MSLLSSPYFPERMSFSSKTGLGAKPLVGLWGENMSVSRIDSDGAVAFEDLGYRRENAVSNDHVFALPWAGRQQRWRERSLIVDRTVLGAFWRL